MSSTSTFWYLWRHQLRLFSAKEKNVFIGNQGGGNLFWYFVLLWKAGEHYFILQLIMLWCCVSVPTQITVFASSREVLVEDGNASFYCYASAQSRANCHLIKIKFNTCGTGILHGGLLMCGVRELLNGENNLLWSIAKSYVTMCRIIALVMELSFHFLQSSGARIPSGNSILAAYPWILCLKQIFASIRIIINCMELMQSLQPVLLQIMLQKSWLCTMPFRPKIKNDGNYQFNLE